MFELFWCLQFSGFILRYILFIYPYNAADNKYNVLEFLNFKHYKCFNKNLFTVSGWQIFDISINFLRLNWIELWNVCIILHIFKELIGIVCYNNVLNTSKDYYCHWIQELTTWSI